MSVEIEVKLRVESHDPVRQRLEGVSARFLRTVLETNSIYDRSDGMLRKRGCGLRMRSVTPEGEKVSRATLTFKGPRIATALKSREELEIDVSDAELLARMLEGIGFVQVLRYEKRRESWGLDGCRVELDEPARLGLFVEIEGPDERTILSVQRKLGLEQAREVPTSYVGMLVAYCEAYDIADRTLNLSGSNANEA